MPEQSHRNPELDAEFEASERSADRYKVATTVPKNPFTGMQWFNPNDGKLKIYRNTRQGWESIN